MKPRILHIVPSLESCGSVRTVKLLARHLAGEFQFAVCGLHHATAVANGLSPEIETFSIGNRGLFDVAAWWRLRQTILLEPPALVHCWGFAAYRKAHTATMGNNLPWLISVRNCADRHLVRTVPLVANGRSVAAALQARGVLSSNITVMNNGVDESPPLAIAKSELLQACGVVAGADTKLIVYAGDLTHEQRIKELIWGIDQLRAVGIDAHLLIVGDGPQRAALVRYARLNHVADRVHFLGCRADARDIIASADVLWHAGTHAGQSLAVLEAMAAGVPVIAADAGGHRELIVAGETGALVPTSERAGFARATLPILEDASLAARMGTAARQRAREHFSAAGMAAEYTKVYRGAIKNTR